MTSLEIIEQEIAKAERQPPVDVTRQAPLLHLVQALPDGQAGDHQDEHSR
jgi:hypothetical protein